LLRITIIERPPGFGLSSSGSSSGSGTGSGSSEGSSNNSSGGGDDKDGGKDGGTGGSKDGGDDSWRGGYKFQVSAIMVAHEPVVLGSYAGQVTDLAKAANQ